MPEAIFRGACEAARLAWILNTSSIPGFACSERLLEVPSLRHGVTLRGEPPQSASLSPSDAFNPSFSTGPDPEIVVASRRLCCEGLGFALDDLTIPEQVHGADVRRITSEDRGRGGASVQNAIPGCDALMTDQAGILLCITVADCLPVFVADPERHAIGLAHSGWRGTAGRIVPRMLEAMRLAYGTTPEKCLVAIGPGIGADGYEVDQKVYSAFPEVERTAERVFHATRQGHWALDLTAAVQLQLAVCGVPAEQIEVSPWHTHRDTTLFHSHRLVPGCPRMGALMGFAPSGGPL